MTAARGFLSIALFLSLAACVDAGPTPPGQPFREPTSSMDRTGNVEAEIRRQISGPLNHDELFRAATRLEPWFGGLYYESGDLRVVSTDLGVELSRAEALAEGVLRVARRPELAARTASALVVPGRFSYVELSDWLDVIRPDLHRYDVHGVNISERDNVIVLETLSPGNAAALRGWVEERGVPAEAVLVRSQGLAVFTHHWGGHAADVERDGSLGAISGCSLAQVVEHRRPDLTPDTAYYAVTNSHCTANFGASGFDRIMNSGSPIADGVWDHPLITDVRCVALTGLSTPRCRYSDAALFRYRSSFASQLHPHKIQNTLDSLHTEDLAFVGEVVNKWGRTTSLTWGVVSDTCVDKLIPASGHITIDIGLLCHYRASYASNSGDSGGPVWLRDESYPQGTRRMFAGIHTFKDSEASYFSSVEYMMHEIVPSGSGWGTFCFSFAAADPGSWTCAW